MRRSGLMVMALVLGSAAAAHADEELPRSLADYYAPQAAQADPSGGRFSLGAVAGYVRVRDADQGTWHGGVVARHQLHPMFAAEASISFHSEEFQNGDVRITTYPLQVTALFFPLPNLPLRPYVLAGGGWYYTRIDYDATLGLDDDTDRQFAVHVGAGGEFDLGRKMKAFADFRWIFLDEVGVDNSNLRQEKFDTWMVSIGALIRF